MGRIIKRGLIAIAPLALTIAVFIWLFTFLEDIFKKPIELIIGPDHYIPGMGIVFSFIVLFLIGAILNTWIITKVSALVDKTIQKIPLVKSLYSAIKEAMGFLSTSSEKASQKVVKVKYGDNELIGLVTREDFKGLEQIGDDKSICVFFPMSYQIGGYTVIIPKSKVTPIDISVEKAMQFILTGGAKLK